MKIQRLHLKKHPLFGSTDISFTGADRKALDTIVISGDNGTGKTALLQTIFKIMAYEYIGNRDSSIQLEFPYIPGFTERTLLVGQWYSNNDFTLWQNRLNDIDEKNRPKVIYMPTEINFENLKTITLSFSSSYKPINVVNQKLIDDVPSFISSAIHSEVFKNMDLPPKTAINKICTEINSLFDILEIDAKLVGLKPEGEKLPIFKNSAGAVFDINHLSAGEKQLFLRAMTLRLLNANNSLILIDEPDISLHPNWQQKIVNVYQKFGKNNQFIFATHSPHVVASVPKEGVKILKRENGLIKIIDYTDISGSYDLPEDIL